MTTFKTNPTYYRVTWNQASPTDYRGLSGSRAGGLDSTSAFKYNNRVSVTGTLSITSTPLSDGDSMIINGVTITFAAADTLADIIERINMASLLTNVIAHNDVRATYVTLTNAASDEGSTIDIREGTGAMVILGYIAGSYKTYPCVVGSGFTNFTNGDTFSINGVPFTMTTAGGLNRDATVSILNSNTNLTGVVATYGANSIQLSSVNGQPFVVSGTNCAKLGFAAGVYGGSPSTLQQSINKELANMRWQQVINHLEMFSTPFLLNDVFGTGNFDGSELLDTFAFTVGYEHPDQIEVVELDGETENPGNILKGVAAIKRAVARGLAASFTGNAKVFDPTITVKGSAASRLNAARIMSLTADGIDTDISSLEDNLSVTMIAYA